MHSDLFEAVALVSEKFCVHFNKNIVPRKSMTLPVELSLVALPLNKKQKCRRSTQISVEQVLVTGKDLHSAINVNVCGFVFVCGCVCICQKLEPSANASFTVKRLLRQSCLFTIGQWLGSAQQDGGVLAGNKRFIYARQPQIQHAVVRKAASQRVVKYRNMSQVSHSLHSPPLPAEK